MSAAAMPRDLSPETDLELQVSLWLMNAVPGGHRGGQGREAARDQLRRVVDDLNADEAKRAKLSDLHRRLLTAAGNCLAAAPADLALARQALSELLLAVTSARTAVEPTPHRYQWQRRADLD